MPEKLSAFVITYNRASLLETCLRAASFADELIVVDKSSTDDSAAIAARYADRVDVVPWSPTVEETCAFAVSLCRHEWVLCLDDDEILSPAAGPWIKEKLTGWDADIVAIPLRHYILGVHDERAYYWPEEHYRLFRKGAVEFIPTVHGGAVLQSDRIVSIPAESGVCIHHLSYQDVASWIDRSNRYTSRPDRVRAEDTTGNLIRFAHEQIEFWMRRTDDTTGNDYPAAVALLRAIYDMVDRLKTWETDRGVDGSKMFRLAQQTLVPAMDERNHCPAAADPDTGCTGDVQPAETQGMLVQLRATEAQLRERTEAARKTAFSLTSTRNELDVTAAMLEGTRRELDDVRATLHRTLATFEQTRTTLHETQSALDETQTALARAWAELTSTRREHERLSNSGRVFARQYAPKLWRYLARRLR